MSNSLFRITYILAIAFLGYLTGAISANRGVFPPYLKDALTGIEAIRERSLVTRDRYDTELWRSARSASKGVTAYSAEKAYNGLTLYTSGHDQTALLVDMDGKLVHQWRQPFSSVWPDPPHIQRPVGDDFIYWRKAMAFPNGDLLAIYVADGDALWGYGLVKLDKDSNVIWRYPQRVHHDVEIGADGRVYTLTHRILNKAIDEIPRFAPPFMDDDVAILSAQGEEIKRISIMNAFVGTAFRGILDLIAVDRRGDHLHTNSLEVVTPAIAEAHPYARPGQILVSIRQISTLVLIDPGTEKVVWASRGPWLHQHDPDLLSNGKILLFDNLGHNVHGDHSKVIEFNPLNGEVVWTYAGDKQRPLSSVRRSAQQRLANGNTLITESDGGRIVEVTRAGEIVWEFMNPSRGGENMDLIAVVSWANRFTREELPFLDSVQTVRASQPR